MADLRDQPGAQTNLVPVFQALSDQTRLRIVQRLRSGERCVCVLQTSLGLAQPLLSHHLRVLREAGLVVGRREGRWVHYSLATEMLEGVAGFLDAVRTDAARALPQGGPCSP